MSALVFMPVTCYFAQQHCYCRTLGIFAVHSRGFTVCTACMSTQRQNHTCIKQLEADALSCIVHPQQLSGFVAVVKKMDELNMFK